MQRLISFDELIFQILSPVVQFLFPLISLAIALLSFTITSSSLQTKQASSRSQVFPLSGASVYEHVSRSGEVTHAKDPGTVQFH